MEAANKKVVGKKRAQQVRRNFSSEKRRFMQLLVSLTIFLVVFFGRNVFPDFAVNLSKILSEDVAFTSAFKKIGTELMGEEGYLSTFLQNTAESSDINRDDSPATAEQALQDTIVRPEPIYLSETKQHGLVYFKEQGILPEIRKIDLKQEEQETTEGAVNVQQEEIVTALAQAYNADGKALPSNVSYEYYEFGLAETACPVMGTVTSGFDFRISPFSGEKEFHVAMDIAANTGTAIRAFADGVVRYIGESDEFGLYFMIDHDNGVSTFYAHCSKLFVRKGDAVLCGQKVALVGATGKATGPHLHFTVQKDGIRLNPAYYVDPS